MSDKTIEITEEQARFLLSYLKLNNSKKLPFNINEYDIESFRSSIFEGTLEFWKESGIIKKTPFEIAEEKVS
jgi:hypothetical protein